MTTAGPGAKPGGDQRHIVVVDDDDDVRETLQEYLLGQGYQVTALDGGPALRALVDAREPFDLAILDITMPGEDGLSLARFLRGVREVGIVMVTASGETTDRIRGLEIGADDYVPKPVDLRELLARVKAVLRRTAARSAIAAPGRPDRGEQQSVAVGDCRLDLEAHRLLGPDGAEVPLTAMEFELLRVLAERPNRVLSRNQLMDLAHDRNQGEDDRSIDIRIARLRRKLERDPAKPEIIRTVRGTGYVFSPGSG